MQAERAREGAVEEAEERSPKIRHAVDALLGRHRSPTEAIDLQGQAERLLLSFLSEIQGLALVEAERLGAEDEASVEQLEQRLEVDLPHRVKVASAHLVNLSERRIGALGELLEKLTRFSRQSFADVSDLEELDKAIAATMDELHLALLAKELVREGYRAAFEAFPGTSPEGDSSMRELELSHLAAVQGVPKRHKLFSATRRGF